MRTISTRPLLGLSALALAASLVLGCGSNNNNSNKNTTNANTALPPSASAAAPVASSAAATIATGAPAASKGPTVAASSATHAAGSPSAAITCASGSITAVGSTALQPLVDAAGKAYQQACPGASINVQGGGSGTGLSQVASGAANIGDSDIFAEEGNGINASGLVDHQVVKQGFVQVVNPSVTGVKSLSQQQSLDIWTGKTKNWKDVGGPDQSIVLILRPASSGTRATFKKVVLKGTDEAEGQALTEDSNGAVAQAVGGTKGAISVLGFAYLGTAGSSITPLQYNGVDATVANIENENYKIFSYGHMYTKGQPSGLTQAFLTYMLSPAVQGGPVQTLGYAPAPSTPGKP